MKLQRKDRGPVSGVRVSGLRCPGIRDPVWGSYASPRLDLYAIQEGTDGSSEAARMHIEWERYQSNISGRFLCWGDALCWELSFTCWKQKRRERPGPPHMIFMLLQFHSCSLCPEALLSHRRFPYTPTDEDPSFNTPRWSNPGFANSQIPK